MVVKLRENYFKLIAEGKTEEEALHICETGIYKNGVVATKIAAITGRSLGAASNASMAMAGGAMVSPVAWAFAGLVFAA